MSYSVKRPRCKQFFRVMRITTLLLFVFIFCMHAENSSSQNVNVTIKRSNTELENVLNDIEKQTDYLFIYNKFVNVDRKVSVNLKKASLEEVLANLFAGTDVKYSVDGSYILLSAGGTTTTISLSAQQGKMVSGVITDINGEPIIGANVIEKDSESVGTVTDVDGKFTLALDKPAATLVVSYIGYLTKEVPVGSQSVLKIILSEDTQNLEEVVVIGYGSVKKSDLTGAVGSIQVDKVQGISVKSVDQMLQGRTSGLYMVQNSGMPGASSTVRIRGGNSISGGNEPLYIIDGMPVYPSADASQTALSPLNSIPTSDIESIEVLKDASAAAIYGSRGSNGVVLVTTKKGTSDKLSVSYDGYVGVQNVSKKLDMMNAYEYAEFVKDARNNAYLSKVPGASASDPNSVRPKGYMQIATDLFPYLEGVKGLTDTDWQDAIFRTAMTTGHNISLSGKSNSVNYFVSGNYMKKEGTIIGSDFEKFGGRLNLSGQHKRLKFGVNFAPSYSVSNSVDASGAGGIVQSALMMPPTFPVYNADGSYNFQGNGYWRIGTDYEHNEVMNPVAMARLQSNVTDRMSITGKAYAELELMKGLSYKLSLGGDYYGAHNDKYRQSGLPLKGKDYYDSPSNPIGYSSSSFFFNWLVENQLTYTTTINKKHNITAILVQSAQKETKKTDNVTATDYPNDYIQTVNGGTVTKGGSDKTQWSIASYLARVQYNYEGRYMLSAAIRTDGSSRFGKNNRWGYFPSASAAWRISDEKFFKNIKELSFVNDMKIRASYGVTGNFEIGNYDHLATMSTDNYILGTNGGLLHYGYKPDNIKRDDLSWEKNQMINAGIDLQMFDGYIGFSVDYYNTNTSNMLLYVPVPLLTGYSTSLQNLGKVNNRGWELALTSQHTFTNGFGYSFNANYAKNTNEVKELGPGNAPIISSGSVGHAYYITEVGKPIGNYYLLVQDGIFATEEDLKKYPHFDNTEVGDFRFVDVDGDGKLDLDKDRTICGNYMPKFTYGFGGKLWYAGFDMDFNFQGVYGNKILNLNKRYLDNMEGNTNGTKIALDRWKSPENPGSGSVNKANRKQTGYNSRTSTWHLESGSYLRLQNLSLGYTLPRALTQKFKVEKMRVYVSGQNLFTITNYSGYNPEVNARPSKNLTPGEDYGTYPLARTYMFGLNLTL